MSSLTEGRGPAAASSARAIHSRRVRLPFLTADPIDVDWALAGAGVIEERFFVWEQGRRQSFSAVATSAPMFHRFGEDIELAPT